MGRLKQTYREEIAPALREKFEYSNLMEIPSITKIVVNMGVGSAITEKKHLEDAVEALRQITGQKPTIRRARRRFARSSPVPA